jgi:hypothetical protein
MIFITKVYQVYLLLKGYQPDGDSIRFMADDRLDYEDLYRYHRLPPDKRADPVQLRLDAIDAPETHYGIHAQPLGNEARDTFLTRLLGFTNIEYSTDGKTVKSCSPETMKATILTRAFDPHGRPISYLYVKQASKDLENKGQVIAVNIQTLDKSINMNLLKEGIVYPLLYTSTPLLHRQHVRDIAKGVRNTNKEGVWKVDSSSMFKLEDYSSITPPIGALIFPKLFRRSIDYLEAVSKGFIGDLGDWLIQNDKTENDHVLIDEKYELRLSVIIEQYNSKVVLKADILELGFIER